jgi:hypothetical protein
MENLFTKTRNTAGAIMIRLQDLLSEDLRVQRIGVKNLRMKK